jgi:hypothetical protein
MLIEKYLKIHTSKNRKERVRKYHTQREKRPLQITINPKAKKTQ